MSFQTERPKSTAQMIAELKESKLERTSNRKALLENFNAKKLSDERQSVLEATQAEVEEKALKNEHIESIRDRRREERAVKESSLNRLTLLESAKKITMNKVLFEMVYDAYWLDDAVKRESIQETYNEYKNVLGLVESVCGDSKTKDEDKTEFIKNVETGVEEACKKAVDRIVKEQKDSGEPDKEFEFTSEEESELDEKLSELGRDELVELIKKKVLTVVQDERKSGKEKAELLKELDDNGDEEEDDEEIEDEEDSDKEDENDKDDDEDENKDEKDDNDESVEEGCKPTNEGKCGTEEGCVREGCKSTEEGKCATEGCIREGCASTEEGCVKEGCKSTSEGKCATEGCVNEGRCATEEGFFFKKKNVGVSESYKATLEAMIAQKQRRSLRNSMGGTLFESFMIANSSSIRDEAVTEGVEIDTASAMNAALIESILQYTVLETLNTTKLYKFTFSDVNKLKAANRSSLRR